MKKTITRTAVVTLIMLLSITFATYAQTLTYYDVYLCGTATATLHPEEPVTPLVSGDKVHWFLDGNPVGNPKEYNGNAASINLVVPADLSVGLHRYTSIIETAANCMGPESDPFTVYKLPAKTLALSAPTNTTYCGDQSGTNRSSEIKATATPGAALPDGIGYTYIWTATKNGTAVDPITTIGSADASNTEESTFTLTTAEAGTYVFSATVQYVKLPGNTGAFKSADNKGCEETAASTQTVTVTPKPGKPTISLED